MKQTITIIFLFLSIVVSKITAQDREIEIIRGHFNYVETNIEKFKVRTSSTFEESTDGATITKYFDDDKLLKIRIEYLGETGKLYREFYIHEQQLLFVLDQKFNYNVSYYIDDKKAKEMGLEEGYDPNKTEKLEHRYYFSNNKLIRWVDEAGKHQDTSDPKCKEGQKYYLDEFSKLM